MEPLWSAGHSLESLFLTQSCRRGRISSTDPTGENTDWLGLAEGETRTFAQVNGCGVIRHIWCTAESADPLLLRKLVLRIYWDGEALPSVEVPLGDFFGMGYGVTRNFHSAPLTMSPQGGRGFNCYFPMPYRSSARFTLQNDCGEAVSFYFNIDFEQYAALPDNALCFHSQWRREKNTRGWADPKRPVLSEPAGDPSLPPWYPKAWTVANIDGRDNYVILEAEGKGHYVGCNLNIDCVERQANDWYGEGDDMIFLDGETLPSIRGTGTEDYFGTAFGPREEFCSPYQGITLYSGTKEWPWKGKNSLYRFHIPDPVYFQKSIRVTIEHGHANKLSNDYSSTAYWYQSEPHAPFPALPGVEERLPSPD